MSSTSAPNFSERSAPNLEALGRKFQRPQYLIDTFMITLPLDGAGDRCRPILADGVVSGKARRIDLRRWETDLKLHRRAIAGVAVSGILMFAQALLPPAHGGLLKKALFDAGHVPLFGLFALILLAAFRRMEEDARFRPYALAFAGVVLMGAVSEYAQRRTGRDAEPMDFLHDLLGGAACLLAARALDRRSPLVGPRRIAALGFAVALLGLSSWPLASLLNGFRQRDHAFPMLFDFEQPWERRFLSTRDAEIEIVDAAAVGTAGHALQIRFGTSEYPTLILKEPVADWRSYQELVFEVFCEEPTRLNIRVDDATHNGSYGDRFNRPIALEGGHTRIEIALQDIRAAPTGRSMDLERIRSVALFCQGPRSLVVDQLRLE